MDQSHNEERVITLQEIIDLVAQHWQTILKFMGAFLGLAILVIFFRPSVFESSALLKINSKSNNDSLLSRIAGGGTMDYFSAKGEMASEQYILTSRTVLKNAVQFAHLDIAATPLYFPLIGHAYANHHTNYKDLSVVHPPLLGLARYNWGGGNIIVSQFTVPDNLKGHPFQIIYRGNNQFSLEDNGKILFQGVVGQPETVMFNGQPLTMMISSILANPYARFTVMQLPMDAAIGTLSSQIKAATVPMTNNLLEIKASGLLNQNLQNRLSAVIDSAMQLSIDMRVQKAKKVLAFLQQQIPVVKDRLDQLNQSMNNTLPMGAQFSNMSREKSIQNLMYTNMLMDIEQYELQKASSLGEIGVITAPTSITPHVPIGQNQLILISLFLGALLGGVYVFARHFVFGIVYSNEQLERVTGLSVIGALSFSKAQEMQHALLSKGRLGHLSLLGEKDENDLTLESLRSARTHLLLNFLSDPKNKIIAISGPTPNIGKSFIAANLAHQLTAMNKKVLLIDADIRKGALWEYFCEARPAVGFIDLLRHNNASSVVRQTRLKNLDFMPSGELNVRHMELLLKEHTQEILRNFTTQYDYIVIDTAPIFAVSDALGICRHADVNLLAFAYGKHNERDIDECVKKFEAGKVKPHGLIMNMIPLPTLGYKYGYYKYGYRYGGYGVRDKEKV